MFKATAALVASKGNKATLAEAHPASCPGVRWHGRCHVMSCIDAGGGGGVFDKYKGCLGR